MSEIKTKRITVNLPEDLHVKLALWAELDERTIHNQIIALLQEAIELRASQNWENQLAYTPDAEELADLLEAIDKSEIEAARGEYYTTEQVEIHMDKFFEGLRQKKGKASA